MNAEMIELEMCVDCTMIVANGDSSGMDETTEAAVVVGLDRLYDQGYHVAMGDETTDFSWTRCDVCGSTLGGTRLQGWAMPR